MFITNYEKKYLNKIEKGIKKKINEWDKNFPNTIKKINKINNYICISKKAKRIRPLIMYYFCSLINRDYKKIINIAIAIELIHNASLMHDDILDNATIRRGKKTVNRKFNNSITLLAGNHLLISALSILKNYKSDIINTSLEIIIKMTRAAIAEIYIRGKINTKIKLCKSIIKGKTGLLFSLCGKLIGKIFNNKIIEKKFSKCAKHLGIAFQIINDLKNIILNNKKEDKYSDIFNKEPTFPILIIIKKSKKMKKLIKKNWKKKKINKEIIKKIKKELKKKKIINIIYKEIKKELNSSIFALKNFNDIKKKNNIVKWINYLLIETKEIIKKNR